MSIDKKDPTSTTDNHADGQIEGLEGAEIEDIDLETVSGGATHAPGTMPAIASVG